MTSIAEQPDLPSFADVTAGKAVPPDDLPTKLHEDSTENSTEKLTDYNDRDEKMTSTGEESDLPSFADVAAGKPVPEDAPQKLSEKLSEKLHDHDDQQAKTDKPNGHHKPHSKANSTKTKKVKEEKHTRNVSADSQETLREESRSKHEPQSSVTTLSSTAVNSPVYAQSLVEDDLEDGDLEIIRARDGAKLTAMRMGPEYFEHSMRASLETRARIYRHKRKTPRRAMSFISWAPWHTKVEQRLQTAAVLFHTVCIAVMLSTFWFFCAVPIFWPLLLPYVLRLLFTTAGSDGKLSRRSDFFRNLRIWDYFAAYFPARLYRSEVLPPTRKYLFGYHPHGILSEGAFIAFGTNALGFSKLFPGITNSLLTLDSNFRLPFFSDYLLALGLSSVSRESCTNHLTKGGPNGEGMGRGITIVLGGASESLLSEPNTMKLVLKSRFGFVKIALETGADLVPVVCFGENELYDVLVPDSEKSWIHRFQMMAKKFLGFTVPLAHARGVFNYDAGLLAYRRRLDIVVGKPVKVKQLDEKDPRFKEELNRLHEEYIRSLQELWDTWKGEFKPGNEDVDVPLEIVS